MNCPSCRAAAAPAPLADKIRAAHLTGERKIVTCLFADVVGSTSLAERMDPLEYLFRHALVHEAAYNSLVKQDRKQLHLAVGEAIERLSLVGPAKCWRRTFIRLGMTREPRLEVRSWKLEVSFLCLSSFLPRWN